MGGIPNVRIPGLRASIPQGYILGRASPGTGEVELIPAPGIGAGRGIGGDSLPNIATQSVLGNVSGATAKPVQVLISALLGVGSALKWTTARTLSFTGDTTGSISVDGSGNATAALTGVQAAKWTTARTLSFTGDATGSMSVDGSAAASAALTLANSGVAAATYGDSTHVAQVTVDAKGRVTGASAVAIAAQPIALSTQTASYTLVLADAETYITLTNASALTVTVPPNSSVAFPVGTRIHVEQGGAGALTIAAGVGVTINSRGSDFIVAGQYSPAVLIKKATDTWTLTGDL